LPIIPDFQLQQNIGEAVTEIDQESGALAGRWKKMVDVQYGTRSTGEKPDAARFIRINKVRGKGVQGICIWH